MVQPIRFGVSVRTEGLTELMTAFRALPAAVQKNALKTAAQAGAVVMSKAMKNNAPVRTVGGAKHIGAGNPQLRYPGFLRDNIGYRLLRGTDAGVVTYLCGLRYNPFFGKNRGAFYGYYLEYGSKHQGARPFIRPAYEANKDAVQKVILGRLDANVAAEWKKLSKGVNFKYLTKGKSR